MCCFKKLQNFFKKKKQEEKTLIKAIRSITGSYPYNLAIYILAVKHTSIAKTNANGIKESNERLEYLGDALLGAIVAEFLFKKYPFKNEGFLTEIRSRIVNREVLNKLAKKIGINKIIEYDRESNRTSLSYKSILGDTLEAFIGAVYLDKGYKFCKKFIINKLIIPHYDLDDIITTDTNFKSKIIEWAQKETKEISFEIIATNENKNVIEFVAEVYIDSLAIAQGSGLSKKKAEQIAAERACEQLRIL